MDKPKVV